MMGFAFKILIKCNSYVTTVFYQRAKNEVVKKNIIFFYQINLRIFEFNFI
jgi:hypothetical protein